jgi:hypothetical protein
VGHRQHHPARRSRRAAALRPGHRRQ